MDNTQQLTSQISTLNQHNSNVLSDNIKLQTKISELQQLIKTQNEISLQAGKHILNKMESIGIPQQNEQNTNNATFNSNENNNTTDIYFDGVDLSCSQDEMNKEVENEGQGDNNDALIRNAESQLAESHDTTDLESFGNALKKQ
eukprot:UN03449